MSEAASQPDRAENASERLGKIIATMPASNELAVLAEILIEQMKVADAQHHVVALMGSTDQKLTATVQALREENVQLTKLLMQARQSFIGEIAVKAADQARRAAAAEVANELAQLRIALESRDCALDGRSAAATARSMLGSPTAWTGIAFCVGAVLVWVVGHLSQLPGI
ncbi:hypothetical protein [Paraburkholderia humisilvae]|uniref:Uncharacterized protein n=1 Tax=Paraburkholderia humisilvae TaxID=627669 RepID=A0A6J5F137_9BURK|nr:hypothetical protein [Paraburkholderia humisilvae]CAB3772103.1 hypothetical protein LMG29542_06796 [Paraburkholderia humisilvae]